MPKRCFPSVRNGLCVFGLAGAIAFAACTDPLSREPRAGQSRTQPHILIPNVDDDNGDGIVDADGTPLPVGADDDMLQIQVFPDGKLSQGATVRAEIAEPWTRFARTFIRRPFPDGSRFIPGPVEVDAADVRKNGVVVGVEASDFPAQDRPPTTPRRISPAWAGCRCRPRATATWPCSPTFTSGPGNSHSDMLECVEAATQKVIDMGYADPKRIGVSGHSYSGEGAAFIGTMSKMFAAVGMGAGVVDLYNDFSMPWGWGYGYQGGSGDTAFNYYLYDQGRWGFSPWDAARQIPFRVGPDPRPQRDRAVPHHARNVGPDGRLRQRPGLL